MSSTSWSIIPPDEALQQEISQALDIHPVTAQILINRGIADVDSARNYLMPELASLPDPFLLPDMDKAVARVATALKADERIAVFGDYDVDGVTSTALMVHFFRDLGKRIDVHIPHRVGEGYGLNVEAVNKFKDRGVSLLITVDNGSRNTSEVSIAGELGIDVIVTDHHEVGEELPNAVAVINPKRPDSLYPDRELAGCGVAFAFLMALRKRLRELGMLGGVEPNLKEHLDLVAIGTVADIVPLRGVNRILAKYGLNQVQFSNKPGLRALTEICGLTDTTKPLRAGHVTFRLAPRLNAAGRMGDAYPALNCLVENDESVAKGLAKDLDKANVERQIMEEHILSEAREEVKRTMQCVSDGAIVVASPRWHPGVVGIVASKLAESEGKPCAVIACDKGVGKGSVRTYGSINVLTALKENAALLDRFGGHSQAAGFTIDMRCIDEFRSGFDAACAEMTSERDEKTLRTDVEIEGDHIDNKLVDEIALLEPYGPGNPEPLLCAKDLKIVDSNVVGGSHLRLRVVCGNARFTAIGFDMAGFSGSLDDNTVLGFLPQYNTWNGQTSIQLKIKVILTKF